MLHQSHAHAARHEGEQRVGLQRGNLGELDLEIQRAEWRVGFLDNLALVVELEAGGGILAGLIVRHQHIDPLVAAVLRDLAEHLVHLVVLVGGHIEKRTAVLAGIARRPGIRADQEGFGVRHRLVDRLQDVGEDRPHHEIDLVALEQAFDLCHRGIRLQLVVDVDNFDFPAAHFAAEILDRERKTVANLLAKCGRRTGEGHDHADLELFLRHRRASGEAEQDRQSGQFQLLFHDLSPDRPFAQPKRWQQSFQDLAYSDDGGRRKQGEGRPGPRTRMQAARQMFQT